MFRPSFWIHLSDEVAKGNEQNRTQNLDYLFRLTSIVPVIPLSWINIVIANPWIYALFTEEEAALPLISNIL